MSLRALIRIAAAALAALPLSLLCLPLAGGWPLLAGPGLLLAAAAWLALSAGPGPVSRWQLRYHLPAGAAEAELDRLERVLAFLVGRGHHVTLEVEDRSLVLAAPAPLEEYVAVQIPAALPGARIVALPAEPAHHPGRVFLATAPLPAAEVLRWATLDAGRRVRVHVRDGSRVTVVACGERPPGPWLRLPGPAGRLLWRKAPVWDTVPAGTRLADLLPTTQAGSTFSSRSRLLELAPPPDYHAGAGRCLGQAVDGRPLTAPDNAPLFLAGAPVEYLAGLAIEDHRRGLAPVVLSPHRPLLERLARQAGNAVWIDAENSLATHHLAIVPAGEWDRVSADAATQLAQQFLTAAGVDLSLDTARTVAQYLTYVLANSAQLTGSDFSFVDLYAVSQGIEALRAFLRDLHLIFPDADRPIHQRVARFEAFLDTDTGYVQAVTALAAIRAALRPLRAGPVHNLAQPPYFDLRATLAAGGPLLVPLTNRDLPEYDRLLCAMLDLSLTRIQTGATEAPRLVLYLHEPHSYRPDRGAFWLKAARAGRASVVLSTAEAGSYTGLPCRARDAELIFACPAPLAASLIRDEELPGTPADLVDLPVGIAVARLPGLPVVALQTDGNR